MKRPGSQVQSQLSANRHPSVHPAAKGASHCSSPSRRPSPQTEFRQLAPTSPRIHSQASAEEAARNSSVGQAPVASQRSHWAASAQSGSETPHPQSQMPSAKTSRSQLHSAGGPQLAAKHHRQPSARPAVFCRSRRARGGGDMVPPLSRIEPTLAGGLRVGAGSSCCSTRSLDRQLLQMRVGSSNGAGPDRKGVRLRGER